MFVGGMVVDEWRRWLWRPREVLDGIQGTDELLTFLTSHPAVDDGAVGHIERSEKCCRAVMLGVDRHDSAPDRLHWRAGCNRALGLAFFTDADDYAIHRPTDVESNEILHLVGKVRVVGWPERTKSVRPKLKGMPSTLKQPDRDTQGGDYGPAGPVRRFVRRARLIAHQSRRRPR